MNRSISLLAVASIVALTGCARVATGEVGLRQNFDKTFDPTELQPGSLNQTFVGDVITFKVQQVAVDVNDARPQASDNSTLKDFDVTAIYSVNPKAVYEIWTKENKSFHTTDDHGDVLLMNVFVHQLLKNAAYKAVRPYEALKMNDNRKAIEDSIKQNMEEELRQGHYDTSISIAQIQVRTMLPADSITESANNLVKAQNDLKQKTVEVQTATMEAQRISALNANPKAIDYMNAQSLALIAKGVAEGKVHSVVVPVDFKGLVNISDK